MLSTTLALCVVPTSPVLRCAISTPFSLPLSPLSPVLVSPLSLLLLKSKDEVLPSGVSW